MKLACIDMAHGRVALYSRKSKWNRPILLQAENDLDLPVKPEHEADFAGAIHALVA